MGEVIWPNCKLISEDLAANNFGFLRIFMALAVVWSHSFALYFGSEDNEPISVLLSGAYNAGNVAVRVFFVVSGFLITQSFLNSKTMSSYLFRRISRILPGYVACIAITTFVIIPIVSQNFSLTPAQAFKSMAGALLLRQNFPPSDIFSGNPVTAVNSSLWSIAFEFWCYIGVIFIAVIGPARYKIMAVLAIALLIVAKVALDLLGLKLGLGLFDDVFGWNYLWADIGPFFLCGSLCYFFRDILPRSWIVLGVAVAVVVGLAHWSGIVARAVFPVVLTYAVLFFAFSEVRFPSFAEHDFSYGTYLYAYPIQQSLVAAEPPFYGYVAVSMIASLFAGAVSWYLVEQHFIRRSRLTIRNSGSVPVKV